MRKETHGARCTGRTPMYARRQGRYTITLPDHIEERLRKIGDGNLSQGVRVVAELLQPKLPIR